MDLEFCLTEENINSAVEQVKQYLAGRKTAELEDFSRAVADPS